MDKFYQISLVVFIALSIYLYFYKQSPIPVTHIHKNFYDKKADSIIRIVDKQNQTIHHYKTIYDTLVKYQPVIDSNCTKYIESANIIIHTQDSVINNKDKIISYKDSTIYSQDTTIVALNTKITYGNQKQKTARIWTVLKECGYFIIGFGLGRATN